MCTTTMALNVWQIAAFFLAQCVHIGNSIQLDSILLYYRNTVFRRENTERSIKKNYNVILNTS